MENLKAANSDFLLETGIESLHQESLTWISQINLWKKELAFFQKLMDSYSSNFNTQNQKKELDHFQNFIIYYNGELLDKFKKKIQTHEKNIGKALKNANAMDETIYRNKHDKIKSDIKSLQNEYNKYKKDFFKFMGKAM